VERQIAIKLIDKDITGGSEEDRREEKKIKGGRRLRRLYYTDQISSTPSRRGKGGQQASEDLTRLITRHDYS
jgi:hypothetical protein